MKKLILLLLPFLTLTACNKSEPEPDADVLSGKEVSYEEFVESAKNTRYTSEKYGFSRMKVRGYNNYHIDDVLYSISGSVEIDCFKSRNNEDGFIVEYNLEVQPSELEWVCLFYGYTKDFQKEEVKNSWTDEMYKSFIAGRLISNTTFDYFGTYFVKDFERINDDIFITSRYGTADNFNFYINPYQISYGSLTWNENYFLGTFNKKGVISKYFEYVDRSVEGYIYTLEKNILIDATVVEITETIN